MKHFNWAIFLFSATAMADGIPPGQWQCSAVDKINKTFTALGQNLNQALSAAMTECKHFSKVGNCHTAHSYCQQGPFGKNCLVTDAHGRAWESSGPDACRTSMFLCTQFQFLNGISSSRCVVRYKED